MQAVQPSQSKRASLFRNGKSQAVRIPRSLEFSATEVLIHRDGERLILEPVKPILPLLDLLAGLENISESFPDMEAGMLPLDEVKW